MRLPVMNGLLTSHVAVFNKMITFVTPLLDGDPHVLKTYNSLKDIVGPDLRWLVKSSSAKFHPRLSGFAGSEFISVVFGRDESLYNGLNQALEFIETPFFAVLGSGDRVEAEVAVRAIERLRLTDALQSYFYAIFHEAKNWHFKARPQEIAVKMSCPHPGAILRTESVRQLNGFDTRYKVAADYDLLCRFLLKHPTTGYSDDILVNFMGNGISSKSPEGFVEEELIRFRVFGRPFQLRRI